MKIAGEIREFTDELNSMTSKIEQENESQTQLHLRNLHAYHDLWPNAKKAVFEDRVEVIHDDNSKLIDKGDSLSIDKGRFITDEEAATMLVNAALAKGWNEIVIDTDNDTIRDYAQAIARGLNIEAHTEEEWKDILHERSLAAAEAAEAADETIEEVAEVNSQEEKEQDNDFGADNEDEEEVEAKSAFTALTSTAVATAEKAVTNNLDFEME